jgi:SWI/SNF-related matrix-associated actin-dependent regulator 1 of chromatin subfamily A
MTVFYIIPENLDAVTLEKGDWHNQERPGHKYIKKEVRPDGTIRYWYPDEGEREDKHTGRKHEEDDYRPPKLRVSDEAALGPLREIGDRLAALQDSTQGKDDTGFSNYDVSAWSTVSRTQSDDLVGMGRLRAILSKYKRQIAGMVGLDGYYQLGLNDSAMAKVEAKASGKKADMPVSWMPDGSLKFQLVGFLGPAFGKYRAAKDQFGVRSRQEAGAWIDYVPAHQWEKFDFKGYQEALAAIGVAMEDPGPRPEQASAAVEVAGTPGDLRVDSAVETIRRIMSKRAHDTIAIKVFEAEGKHQGKVGIWSTYSADFNFIMSNQSVGPEALSGVIETDKTLGFVRLTNSPLLYREALEKIRKKHPHFTFVIDPNVAKWEADHEAATLERQKPIPEVQAKINPDIKPFPFQNEAVRFFRDNGGNGLLGDEMGLGKTMEALSYAAAESKRTLVVCPKVVRKNWLLEAKRFFPGHFDDVKELRSADIKKEGLPDLSKVKLATINYEILEKFMPAILAAGFDLLIVDESHRCKNSKAKLTKNVQKIGKNIASKILLSGTAIKNRRDELFTQLELVKPGFVTMDELKSGMIGALHHKLAHVYLARKKRDVVADMPPKLRQAIELDVSGLPQAVAKSDDWMDDAELSPAERKELSGGGSSELAEVTRLKHETAKAKAPVTADFVQELLDSSDSNVLVFTDSKVAARAIAEKLGAVAVIHTGDESDKDKDAARGHFDPLRRQEGDPVRVFVSTTAMGIGFNAQTADKVVFNDLPWTPADKDQAEDRAYRIGTKNTVNVYDIHASGSAFDTVTAQLLLKKSVLYHKLLDGKKLTAEETAWATVKLRASDILAAMRGEVVGPTVVEVDAPAAKASDGTVIIEPVPDVSPPLALEVVQAPRPTMTARLEAKGHKVYPKEGLGQALQDNYDEHKAKPKFRRTWKPGRPRESRKSTASTSSALRR